MDAGGAGEYGYGYSSKRPPKFSDVSYGKVTPETQYPIGTLTFYDENDLMHAVRANTYRACIDDLLQFLRSERKHAGKEETNIERLEEMIREAIYVD